MYPSHHPKPFPSDTRQETYNQIETAPVEKPLFLKSGQETLKNGFYTIESGLYKDFGMRLENDYFVDEAGATNLFENLMPLVAKEYILK